MNSPAISYENVIAQLAERVPEYRPSDPDLPHVAFGGLVAFLGDRLDAGKGQIDDVGKRIVDFVEAAANSTDEQVIDLVVVSFIENLHGLGPHCRAVVSQLGRRTGELARQYERSTRSKLCP